MQLFGERFPGSHNPFQPGKVTALPWTGTIQRDVHYDAPKLELSPEASSVRSIRHRNRSLRTMQIRTVASETYYYTLASTVVDK